MIHLGDITKISGYTAPPVEVIIGGSPCQDLSVAGKRAGLQGERSGLFMEQIRVIKEMRENDRRIRTDDHVRPRYMVWENVPGAFSSAKGEDFRAVLEETARIADENAVIPRPEGGKWTTAGSIMGDGWSIAWRVLDAQYWGVPQRRRRIALVADFGGHTAPEVLFEREGVCGNPAESGTTREGTAGDAETGIGTAICIQGNCIDRADTAECNGRGWRDDDVSYTLNTIDRPAVFDCRGNGDGETAPTLTGDHQNRVTDYTAVCIGSGDPNIAGTLDAPYYKGTGNRNGAERTVVCAMQNAYNDMLIAKSLKSSPCDPHREDAATYPITNSLVRRLTPMECERLQGYPDGWTDLGEWTDSKGKAHQTSDSARYKALGNSIALPPWRFVLGRLNAYLTEHTMASLFDGIGGFPLIWQELNGRGKCLWASEIEEFTIAVTKRRFEDAES